jgi:hypothetical protein
VTELKEHFIEVRVVTTSGSFPKQGLKRITIHQPIEVILHEAAKELKITDTSNWVARVGDREVDVSKSYADNNLSGKVVIDYGPKEGGGGNA